MATVCLPVEVLKKPSAINDLLNNESIVQVLLRMPGESLINVLEDEVSDTIPKTFGIKL